MLIRDTCKPLTDVTWVHLTLSFFSASTYVLGLFLECGWLVETNLSLSFSTVHTCSSVLGRCNLLDFFDDA